MSRSSHGPLCCIRTREKRSVSSPLSKTYPFKSLYISYNLTRLCSSLVRRFVPLSSFNSLLLREGFRLWIWRDKVIRCISVRLSFASTSSRKEVPDWPSKSESRGSKFKPPSFRLPGSNSVHRWESSHSTPVKYHHPDGFVRGTRSENGPDNLHVGEDNRPCLLPLHHW